MNCEDFRSQLLRFVDGELPGPEGVAARQHEASCADCRSRAAFERAFEERVGAALIATAEPGDFGALLAGARRRADADGPDLESDSPPTARGRLLTLRRLIAVAAGLLLAVQVAWFFCIPPFECSYLQAVEAATEPDAATVQADDLEGFLARIDVPPSIGEARLLGEPEIVLVGFAGVDVGIRARYAHEDGVFTVLWCDPDGLQPSFRRHTSRGGVDWWIATENGKNLVAWMCPVTDTMCTLVGDIPEERLVAVASGMRGSER